jgi:hypothetical protein
MIKRNEPHGIASWGESNPATDFNKFAERCINRMHAKYPDWKVTHSTAQQHREEEGGEGEVDWIMSRPSVGYRRLSPSLLSSKSSNDMRVLLWAADPLFCRCMVKRACGWWRVCSTTPRTTPSPSTPCGGEVRGTQDYIYISVLAQVDYYISL